MIVNYQEIRSDGDILDRDEQDDLPNEETVLCKMIKCRKLWSRPSSWPMFDLWRTTEGMILTAVDQYMTLEGDGLTHWQIVQKIEAFRSPFGEGTPPAEPGLPGYLRYRLTIEDPGYLAHGTRILDRVVSIAVKYIERKIETLRAQKPYPPLDWLERRVTVGEVEHQYNGSLTYDMNGVSRGLSINPKWQNLKLRMLNGDELWKFSSSAASWATLGGREGYCVVRDRPSIAHIITYMN